MDAGITIKPSAGVAIQDYAPPIAVQTTDPIATDLPAAKAVTAAAASQTRNDTQAQSQATTREVIIDPLTREVIYRLVDVRSRQVVRQVPDEVLLRVRAYAAALAKGNTPSQAQYQADIEV